MFKILVVFGFPIACESSREYSPKNILKKSSLNICIIQILYLPLYQQLKTTSYENNK